MKAVLASHNPGKLKEMKLWLEPLGIELVLESDLGLNIEVEYITDMEKVMGYGVMSMPAIVVNEQVVSMGKVLKASDVEKLLRKLGC